MSFVNVHVKVGRTRAADLTATAASSEAFAAQLKNESWRATLLATSNSPAAAHSEKPFVAAYGPYSGKAGSIEQLTKTMLEKK